MNELSVIVYFLKSSEVTPMDFLRMLNFKSVEFTRLTPSDLGLTQFASDRTPVKVTLKFKHDQSLGALEELMPLLEKVAY